MTSFLNDTTTDIEVHVATQNLAFVGMTGKIKILDPGQIAKTRFSGMTIFLSSLMLAQKINRGTESRTAFADSGFRDD
jgi:hypothetical protein